MNIANMIRQKEFIILMCPLRNLPADAFKYLHDGLFS